MFSPQAKYIYIARDGRDVIWSLYNHHANATEDWYQALNDTPGRVGPPIPRPPDDIRQYFRDWLDGRRLSVLAVLGQCAELVGDPRSAQCHAAAFLRAESRICPARSGASPPFSTFPSTRRGCRRIVEHCSFDYMKRNAGKAVPLGGAFWDGGAETFIHKGINGRWRDVLSPDESGAYEVKARAELGEPCAAWLAGN